MTMTKYQLNLLRIYARCRQSSALSQAVRATYPQSVSLLLVTGALFGYCLWRGWPSVGWMYFGIFLGVFLRDARGVLRFCRNWPVLAEIIDWDRVSEILKESDDVAAAKSAEGQ